MSVFLLVVLSYGFFFLFFSRLSLFYFYILKSPSKKNRRLGLLSIDTLYTVSSKSPPSLYKKKHPLYLLFDELTMIGGR
ncbi:hypothetical protein F5X96DRAFT_623240 [Biscogniauxia mediterranea]|nr:hypothetical protein F5X96DRAFT_623240 [Biscogniauxia mediterranea]